MTNLMHLVTNTSLKREQQLRESSSATLIGISLTDLCVFSFFQQGMV